MYLPFAEITSGMVPAAVEGSGYSAVGAIVRMVAGLLITLGAFILFLRFMKKAQGSISGNGKDEAGSIDILARAYLSPGKPIHLIGVCGRKILLGESDAGFVKLAEFPDDTMSREKSETEDKTAPGILSSKRNGLKKNYFDKVLIGAASERLKK